MCRDPLDLAIEQWKEEITHEEVSKDQPETDPGEADTTAPGSEVEELFNRRGSAPLQLEDLGDDSDEDVKAQPKIAAELANLKILLHRTPEGVRASGEIRQTFQYEIVPLPRHMYQNQYRHN